MSDECDYDSFIIGAAIGALAIFSIFVIANDVFDIFGTDKLGIAICEEEYGMTFDRYTGGVLHCKGVKERYDGLTVDLGDLQVQKEAPE